MATVSKSGINPIKCQYGENCRTKKCTFTHDTPPVGHLICNNTNDCRFDRNCTRRDCFHDHVNGRIMDDVTVGIEDIQSEDDLIASIETLLSEANEQLCSKEDRKYQLIGGDDDDSDQSEDEEPVLDIITLKRTKEFELQKEEFRSAVVAIQDKFNLLNRPDDDHILAIMHDIHKQLQREIKHWKSRLPIYARRKALVKSLQDNQILILKADTGSGKSTQIVQYLCDEQFANNKQIICTQPRKLAARTLAGRVAEEYGCRLGQEVGFYIGGRRPETTSDKTKIKFVTDTILLKEYKKDPLLNNYSIVIIDEAHERKIDTDIAFGIMKQCLKKRTDLKLIVMSATLDKDLLYKYFTKNSNLRCGNLEVEGRTFPIQDIYLDDDVENYGQAAVAEAAKIHRSEETGDILIFLTGEMEIDLAINELNQKLGKDETYLALPLHGKLTEEETNVVFKTEPGKRKIIFSTNVAETSVTIEGIKHVIDSGMVKEKMWDEKRKMQVLKVGQITKSSVKQRRGRAGRMSAGKCYHLYTTTTYQSMEDCSRAEIRCTQPTLAILKLKYLGVDDTENFEWLEPPSSLSLHEATQTLYYLNALNDQGKLTDLGKHMAYLDIDPKLTAMLYKGIELKCLDHMLIMAGMLSISQNIWWRCKGGKDKLRAERARLELSSENSDHISLLNVYLNWQGKGNRKEKFSWCEANFVNAKSMNIANEFIEEVAKQMNHVITICEELNEDLSNRILQCVAAGYFQNIALSNGPLRAGYRVIPSVPSISQKLLTARVSRYSALSLNGSVLLLNESAPKYVLYNELVNLNGINSVMTLSKVDLTWLGSVSKQWYTDTNIGSLHRITYEKYTFTPVTVKWALLRSVLGKRYCKLNMINEEIQGVVDVNQIEKTLTIWCEKGDLDAAKKIIREKFESEKQKLSDERDEIQIAGRTRIVMGKGGHCKMILVEDEFIQIILKKLPGTIKEEEIREMCKTDEVIKVHDITVLQQTSNGVSAAVTYTTPEEAHRAYDKLTSRMTDHEISIGANCLKSNAFVGSQNTYLKAIWYMTPSTGNGRIVFTNEKNAIDVHNLFSKTLHWQCHYRGPTDFPRIKIIYYRGSNTKKGEAVVKFQTNEEARLAVREMTNTQLETAKIICAIGKDKNDAPFINVKGLPSNADEEDVRKHFQSCAGVIDVTVKRNQNLDAFDEDNAKDQLRKLFQSKKYLSFQHDTVTFKKFGDGRVEAYGIFSDGAELKDTVQEMDGKTDCIGCGKIRLSLLVKNNNKKPNEHIVQIEGFKLSIDKYDIIKILREHQLYDHVTSITVYRQKFKNKPKTFDDAAKEDEDRLADLRAKFESDKECFLCKPNYHILQRTTDGTATALICFDNPLDVVKAIEKHNNSVIQFSDNSYHSSSNLRLIPSMAHEIIVHPAVVKAILNQIQDAVTNVKEEYGNSVHIKLYTSLTDKPTMKISIDGDDYKQIQNAKSQFEALLKGKEYIFDNDIEKMRIIFAPAGRQALQRIETETTGSYIWWNTANGFIRIYGTDQACAHTMQRIDEYIQEVLANKTCTVTLPIPHERVLQVQELTADYEESAKTKWNVQIAIHLGNRKIIITGNQSAVANCKDMIKNSWEAMLSDNAETTEPSSDEKNLCEICLQYTTEYRLQECGHFYCLGCLKSYIRSKFSTSLTKEDREIKCLVSDCNSPLLLRDIKVALGQAEMPKLAYAVFQAYVQNNREELVECLGTDCIQVYRKAKHPIFFSCDWCSKIYCVKCRKEYHYDFTCDENAYDLSEEKQKILASLGAVVKPCPSCKYEWTQDKSACNAMKCTRCNTAFCWLCGFSDPNDVHPHFKDSNSKCHMKLGVKED